MKHCVYVLQHPLSKRVYVGSTADLDRRLVEHRLTKPEYKLIYQENRQSKEDALKRELYLKSGNGRRALQTLLNPTK
jgi:putative endonuclease